MLNNQDITKPNLIIGIDPDLVASGFAVVQAGQKSFIELKCLDIFNLFMYLQENQQVIKKVVIEAGWLNRKSNWHGGKGESVAASIGRKVGENHATGKLIECFSKGLGLQVQLLTPKKSKKNAEEFLFITGYKGRTNPETRDAGLLVYGM